MPLLPDWPASPPIVRCGRTSISTVTLLVGGEMPWLTPTETPGAMYFRALRAVPPVADVPVPAGFRVPAVAPVGPEPSLKKSRPRPPREHARTTAGERGRRCGELQSLIGSDLIDAIVEQNTRENLVLWYDRVRSKRDLWPRRTR